MTAAKDKITTQGKFRTVFPVWAVDQLQKTLNQERQEGRGRNEVYVLDAANEKPGTHVHCRNRQSNAGVKFKIPAESEHADACDVDIT